MAKGSGGARTAGRQETGGTGDVARRRRELATQMELVRDAIPERLILKNRTRFETPFDFDGKRFFFTMFRGDKTTGGALVAQLSMYRAGSQRGDLVMNAYFDRNFDRSKVRAVNEVEAILQAAILRGTIRKVGRTPEARP